jgi:hypothetical protein
VQNANEDIIKLPNFIQNKINMKTMCTMLHSKYATAAHLAEGYFCLTHRRQSEVPNITRRNFKTYTVKHRRTKFNFKKLVKKKDCQFGAFLLDKYVAVQVQVHKFNYNKHDENVVVVTKNM